MSPPPSARRSSPSTARPRRRTRRRWPSTANWSGCGLSCSPCHAKICPLGHINCLNTLDVGTGRGGGRPAAGSPGRRMKVLIVKTSSMGDVIHTFPAVEDVAPPPSGRVASTGAWKRHSPTSSRCTRRSARSTRSRMRRWRKALFDRRRWREAAKLRRALAGRPLRPRDRCARPAEIGAGVAAWRASPIAGLDRSSAREPAATLFYDYRFPCRAAATPSSGRGGCSAQALGYQPDLSDAGRRHRAAAGCPRHSAARETGLPAARHQPRRQEMADRRLDRHRPPARLIEA